MKIPLKEMLGAIPGAVGIRTEAEPPYRLIREVGAFQLRRYEEMIVAQTTVEGPRDEAVNEGFRRLADYIFGPNNDEQKQMSMTTPVLQAKMDSGWLISFVLEHDYTMETAPKPVDPNVKLALIPPKTVATYRYNGNMTEENMKEAADELRKWLDAQNFSMIGEVAWGQYDQPFAVPFLKRNEAYVEIRHELS